MQAHGASVSVLFLLRIDDDHDEVHVQPGRRASDRSDAIEALQEVIETAQHSLDSLRKIRAMTNGA